MSDSSRETAPPPDPTTPAPADAPMRVSTQPAPAPGPVTVNLGGVPPAQGAAPRPAGGAGRTGGGGQGGGKGGGQGGGQGGGDAAAIKALRQEMQALRGALAAAAPKPDAPAETNAATDDATVGERLEALTRAVQTLETYLSIGFFDRVRGTLGEAATELRPVALERRVARLRGLVRGLLLVQLATLGLVVALNGPQVMALAQAAWAGLVALLASAGVSLPVPAGDGSGGGGGT
ncbi:hypothetical protein [Roseospira goensis]|uniref:Uncharacterized protein n=1 Tax=Roseospira goensis TaxID=391922 RepID=A0A7W6RZN7_9PROT|nr:hypothetical protein [Roseospira goensis]MBB4286188.1 hypothetical protein [Roseospira goensis]